MNATLTKHKDIFSICNIVHVYSHQGVNFPNEIILLLRLLGTFLWVGLALALCHRTRLRVGCWWLPIVASCSFAVYGPCLWGRSRGDGCARAGRPSFATAWFCLEANAQAVFEDQFRENALSSSESPGSEINIPLETNRYYQRSKE